MAPKSLPSTPKSTSLPVRAAHGQAYWQSALLYAIKHGDVDGVGKALVYGADANTSVPHPNHKQKERITVVMFALRQLGAKAMNSVVSVQQNGTQARANLQIVKREIHKHNLFEIVRLLCQAGAIVNCRCGPHSLSALHESCHLNSFHVFDILSNFGGDLSRPDLCLRNVLHHHVAFYGLPFECSVPERLKNLNTLLKRLKGAGMRVRDMVNDFDHIGLTPFMILCRYPEPRNSKNRENYATAVDAMLSAGARPNLRATRAIIRSRMATLCRRRKRLPLMYARYTLAHRFPIKSAVEWAQERNNHTLVCYLSVREAARVELDVYLPVDLSREILAFAYSYLAFDLPVAGKIFS